jgi:small-conductance mechanosensitive channel
VNALEPLLLALWKDLHDVRVLWQVLAIAVSLGIAWWVSRLLRPRLTDPGIKWQYSAGGLRRVRFPLIALVLVLIGRWVLAHYQGSLGLLNLAVPLLVALAIVRIVLYMLQLVFSQGTTVTTLGRAISWVVWLGFAVYITGFAPDLIDFLDETGLRVGKQRISLLIVLQATLSIVVALLVSLWLGHVFEGRVMQAENLDINLRVMLTKLMRPLLVLLAILIALPMLGIDLTALSVFGGALGVGIGFGLQKTASNYVSGFIVLLDRSVKIGDLVTIEEHTGQLTKMTARYVVVRSLDGTEVIIPNETVITSTVVNHSYSDRKVLVLIPVQISYRSDLDAAMRVLVDAATSHARVLQDPRPKVLIKAFADNGIDLELNVWVKDPEEGRTNLRSDIYYAVWREFQAKGIEIPSPQREVRLLAAGGTAAQQN